jgi:uncharacterized protein (DUF1778 family)
MQKEKKTKNQFFKIRINDQEKEVLKKQAEINNMSLSELIRAHVITNTKTN